MGNAGRWGIDAPNGGHRPEVARGRFRRGGSNCGAVAVRDVRAAGAGPRRERCPGSLTTTPALWRPAHLCLTISRGQDLAPPLRIHGRYRQQRDRMAAKWQQDAKRPGRESPTGLIFRVVMRFFRSGGRDSNSRQPAWKAGTLPTELPPQLAGEVYASGRDEASAQPAFRPAIGSTRRHSASKARRHGPRDLVPAEREKPGVGVAMGMPSSVI